MAVATLISKPVSVSASASLSSSMYQPLKKKPLPAGQPREWYVSHNHAAQSHAPGDRPA